MFSILLSLIEMDHAWGIIGRTQNFWKNQVQTGLLVRSSSPIKTLPSYFSKISLFRIFLIWYAIIDPNIIDRMVDPNMT